MQGVVDRGYAAVLALLDPTRLAEHVDAVLRDHVERDPYALLSAYGGIATAPESNMDSIT